MKKFIVLLLIVLTLFVFIPLPAASAATSPTLVGASSFSVLGGAAVTNTGSTTTTGAVGVSPGTSITNFPPGIAGGGTHSNDASAIAAQADNLATFTTLDQTCDHSYGAQDLTLLSPLPPGVYCSTSSFSLTGNLTLTGSGVWIFKSASTLITSSGSSVTGGDPCNVWWRVGSSATLGTTTSFIGNILSLLDITMNTGANLNGRALSQAAGTVTLGANTITGPTCVAPTTTPTATPTSVPSSGGGGGGGGDGLSDGRSDGRSSGVTAVVVPTIIKTNSPGFPNTGGIPRLPNTGIGPDDVNISLNIVIAAGIIALASTSLVVYFKKRII